MTLEQQAQDKEFKIRGRIIQITSTLENFLVKAILITKSNAGEDDNMPFDDMGLTDKIMMLKKVIKQHHPTIFPDIKKAIKKYLKACKFRNQMAHCTIEWPDETLQTFVVFDTGVAEDGMHIITPVVYTTVQALEEIEKTKAVGAEIINLIKPISDEFDRRIQELFRPKG